MCRMRNRNLITKKRKTFSNFNAKVQHICISTEILKIIQTYANSVYTSLSSTQCYKNVKNKYTIFGSIQYLASGLHCQTF